MSVSMETLLFREKATIYPQIETNLIYLYFCYLIINMEYLLSDKVQTENKILRKALSLTRQSRSPDNNSMQSPCFFVFLFVLLCIYAALETSILFHGPRDHENLIY